MGWTGSKAEMPIGMLLKKMYCGKCGTRLKIKKSTRLIKKGDKDFSSTHGSTIYIGMSQYELTTYSYICPSCHREVSYDEQLRIDQKQKGKEIKKQKISSEKYFKKIQNLKNEDLAALILICLGTVLLPCLFFLGFFGGSDVDRAVKTVSLVSIMWGVGYFWHQNVNRFLMNEFEVKQYGKVSNQIQSYLIKRLKRDNAFYWIVALVMTVLLVTQSYNTILQFEDMMSINRIIIGLLVVWLLGCLYPLLKNRKMIKNTGK